MIKSLYPPFRKWTEKGTLWVYSDPHFSDPDCIEMRKNYIGDDEQVARINSKVGKNDTIIFLGDIGNEEMIRKIRGYKVLIMGNHDKGASKYKRHVTKNIYAQKKFTKQQVQEDMTKRYPGWKYIITEEYDLSRAPYEFWVAYANDGLFDEVYEGPLFIAEKLILSHEPIDLPYAVNIHGHEHRYIFRDHHFNVCAEYIDYTPINLDHMIKHGILSQVDSIHRITIDNAAMRKRLKEIEAEGGTRCQFFDFCGDNPERCKKCDYYDAE